MFDLEPIFFHFQKERELTKQQELEKVNVLASTNEQLLELQIIIIIKKNYYSKKKKIKFH